MPVTLRQADGAAAADGDWLPIAVAAVKLGLSPGHLRRKCVESWSRAGLARQVDGAWQVHAAADARLRQPVDAARRDREQLAGLTAAGVRPQYLDLAELRRDLVVGYSAWVRERGAEVNARQAHQRYVGHLAASRQVGPHTLIARLSVATFYAWESIYADDGLRGLVPKAGFRDRAESGGIGAQALDYVCRLMDCGNRISLAAALTITRGEARQHGEDPAWLIGSYSSVRLAVAARRPRILRVAAERGEKAAIADCVPKLPRDFESVAAGDEYVGDERTLDVWCRVRTARGWKAVRPKLTAWQDLRSRMIVGAVLSATANTSTILGALKLAIAAHGKPRILRTDWGEDYKKTARHGVPKTRRGEGEPPPDQPRVDGILTQLGIEVHRTLAPYMPWAKPIESFFRAMKDHFDRLYGGFWGGCPSERHEDRARWIKANLEKLPTLDELRTVLMEYLEQVYHRTPHSAPDLFGKTPLEAMAAFRVEPVRSESTAVLDLLFREFVGPFTVRRDGVRHNARWYGHGDARLVPLQRHKVLLAIQPEDQGRALVCRLDRTPLFEVECLALSGRTREETAELMRQKQRIIRPYRKQVKEARQWLLSTPPAALLANRAAGLPRGAGSAAEGAAPRLTVVRPHLEEAISTAGRAPSDAASKAVRSGTDDDDLTLDDLIDADQSSWRPPPPPDGDGDDDGITFDDLTGE